MEGLPPLDSVSFGLSCWQGHPTPMPAAHRHDDLELNLARSGPLVYLFGGTRVEVPDGRAAVFWGARPHQLVEVSDDAFVTWLTVPLATAAPWGLPSGFRSRLLQGEILVPEPDQLAQLEQGLERWRGELSDGSDYTRHTVELELEATFRRLATQPGSGTTGGPGGATDEATRRAGAMAAFIAASYPQDIRVEDVARSVHLHPQYAMSVFREVVGTTVGAYITACRVAEAQRLLLTTDLPVTEVGMAAGFRSQSQFYDHFGRACGQSPARYRRAYGELRHSG